jgi:hypothetical protein
MTDRANEALVRKVLSDPSLFPPEFKAWVPRHVEKTPTIRFEPYQVKLADSPSAGKVLTIDPTTLKQTWASPAAPPDLTPFVRVYDRVTAALDVNTDVTERTLYTKSIVGGDMSIDKMLRLTLKGDFLHNNVAGDTVRIRVKFGGTTFLSDTFDADNVIAALRQPWKLVIEIANLGVANSQHIDAQFWGRAATEPAPTNGIGAWDAVARDSVEGAMGISTLGTIDTTTAQTLDVTVQWSASSANDSWRRRYAVLELV